MRTLLALWVGKFIFFLTRNLKLGGGSAAPGLYALKICPNLVSDLTPQIPQNIIITGTNGKTTTARLLSHFAKTENLKVVRNSTGSNLERGIASTLVAHSSLLGKIKADLGIWELDEAAFNRVAPKLNPQIIVFLNVFRDQLDRYGEVDTVLKKWSQTLRNISVDTMLLLNADDQNIYSLKDDFAGKTESFSFPKHKISGEKVSKKTQKDAQFAITDVKINGLDSTNFDLKFYTENIKGNFPLPGTYNLYNFLASFAVGFHLNLETQKMVQSLENFSPAFGRVEKIELDGHPAYICLIKNPTGATQVFETIKADLKPNDTILLALNDNFADGLDVSWIWDAEFELLCHPELVSGSKQQMPKQVRHDNVVICSGTRAQELAVRLKYAGVGIEQLIVENSLNKALFEALEHTTGRIFILPTYTALLQLQKLLANMGAKEHYWKND